MPFRIFLMALLFIIYGTANAQNNYLKFSSLTRENGLSQNAVNCVLQDRHGFMWIGTDKGLNKYNGYDFTIYLTNEQQPHSISHDAINCLYETRSGHLWIGTNNGLNRYNEITNQFEHIGPAQGENKPFKVNTILEDRSGSLWIGASDGLYQLESNLKNFKVYRLEQGSIEVNALHEDAKGDIWAGSTRGLARLDKAKQRFIIAIPSIRVKTITEDATGTLWAGCTTGLHILDLADSTAKTQQSLPINTPVNSIFVDQSDDLWIGTNTGLFVLNKPQRKLMYYNAQQGNANSLNHNQVNCIYQDKTGIVWIGTHQGINKITTPDKNFLHYRRVASSPTSLSSDTVNCFLEDRKGNLWIGTGNGLNLLDSITGDFLHYTRRNHPGEGLSHSMISALCQDAQGLIWIGTARGLNSFDPHRKKFLVYTHIQNDSNSLSSNEITALYEDKSRNLWIGTRNGGLSCLTAANRQTGFFKNYGQRDQQNPAAAINIIYQDKDGFLWIGTHGAGLEKFDPRTGQFTPYQQAPKAGSLSHNVVWSLAEDERGNLWVGTEDGLHLLNKKTGLFTVYNQKQGLPDARIYGIIAEKQNLWLSSHKGLTRFNPTTGENRNFTSKDGLQGNVFNGGAYYKSRSGELFFGGNQGFNAFYPDQISSNPHSPKVVFTTVKTNKGELLLDSQLVIKKHIPLTYAENSVSFEFAALNYAPAEENQYAYRLEGIDEEWVYAGTKRIAHYENLPAGKYLFRVKAANKDGVWNEQGANLWITVQAPFWASWWFITFSVCLLLAAFFLFFKLKRQKTAAAKLSSANIKN